MKNIFGFRFISEKKYKDASQSLADRVELQVQKDALMGIVKRLEAEVKTLRTVRPAIEINIGDPSPVDKEQRRLYVAQVAGLYKDILEPKLKQMISSAYSVLKEETNSREQDVALKGAIYSFEEFMRWGETMVNEQVGNQINIK